MPSQTQWITPASFHLSSYCPKLTWLSVHHKVPLASAYTTFFSEVVLFLIQKFIENDPSIHFIDPNQSIELRYKETLSRLNAKENIANGCLCWQHYTCPIDRLRYSNGQWILSYIHPSLHPHKKDYITIAYIVHLLRQHHIIPDKIEIIFINEQYQRGQKLDINKLCRTIDVTSKVRPLIPAISAKLLILSNMVTDATPPAIKFGLYCLKPSPCQFLSTCFPTLVNSPSILSISGISKQKKVSFIQKDIISLYDLSSKVSVTDRQSIQISCELDRVPYYDYPLIRQFLASLSLPLYFMDFEVAQFIIPPFAGLQPLHRLPFQYSIHSLTNWDSEPIHTDFLPPSSDNPERQFAMQLSQAIPPNVSVIVFNDHLEKIILRYLYKQFPEYRIELMRISGQLVDLSSLFLKNAYYHPKMKGKYSLKDIYTAISAKDDIQFHDLSIKNGESANIAYKQFLYEKRKKKKSRYCSEFASLLSVRYLFYG